MKILNAYSRRIAADKAAGFPAPDLVPDPECQTAVQMGMLLLASGMCGIHNVPVLLSDRVGYGDFVTVWAGTRFSITYRGPRLSPRHVTVLLHLVALARGKGPGDRIGFHGPAFVVAMGWPDSKYSRDNLWQILLDLHRAAMASHFDKSDLWGNPDGIIDEPKRELVGRRKLITFCFSKDGMQIFRGHFQGAYISLVSWRALNPGLETWLYGWVKSMPCYAPTSLTELYSLTGATGLLKVFGRSVRKALTRLQDEGLIDGYYAERGKVRIYKRRVLKKLNALADKARLNLKRATASVDPAGNPSEADEDARMIAIAMARNATPAPHGMRSKE